ncbi:MAG: MAPEG family protein [Rhodovibrionaceae bacterium]
MEGFPVPITAVIAALNALILMALAAMIPARRMKAQVNLGTGESDELLRAVRAHGNATEYIPIALILILILELLGAPAALLWGLGAVLTVARLAHPIAIYKHTGPSLFRGIGVLGSVAAIVVAALACLYYGLSI